MSEHDSHWTAKAVWMRSTGATDAAWSTEGDLVHLRLGPPVVPLTEEEKYAAETQPSRSPQEQERLERLKRRDIVARSSGGPVRRLDAED